MYLPLQVQRIDNEYSKKITKTSSPGQFHDTLSAYSRSLRLQKPNTHAAATTKFLCATICPQTRGADFFSNAWEGSLLRIKLEDLVEPLKACVYLMPHLFFKSAPNVSIALISLSWPVTFFQQV
jgi:hypothetical protein